MTDDCTSPDIRGFKEIREWIDVDGHEVRSEMKDVGEILNRAEKLVDVKGSKKGESKWKPKNGNDDDTVEPIREESAFPSGLPLDTALDKLESAERIAENKAVERLISAKRIVGNGWKKGFLNKPPPRRPPHKSCEKQVPFQEVKDAACQNDGTAVTFKNGVISDPELKSHQSDEGRILREQEKQQQLLHMEDQDHPSEKTPFRMSRFKAERMKNRK